MRHSALHTGVIMRRISRRRNDAFFAHLFKVAWVAILFLLSYVGTIDPRVVGVLVDLLRALGWSSAP